MTFIRLFIILTLVMCNDTQSIGQYVKIDSLEKLYESANQNDTNRILILINLSKCFRKIDDKKSLEYANQSHSLAHQMASKDGRYQSLQLLWQLYLDRGELRESLEVIKNAISIAQELQSPEKIAMSKARLGLSYYLLSYNASAFTELAEAIKIFTTLGDRRSQAFFAITLGNLYLEDEDYAQTYQIYNDALTLSMGDSSIAAIVSINVAAILQKQGKYNESFYHISKGLRWGERNRQYELIGAALMLCGKSYFGTGDFMLAKSSYSRALAIFETSHDINSLANCLIALGEIAAQEQNFNLALELYFRALPYSLRNQQYFQLVQLCSNISNIYEIVGNYDQALKYQSDLLQYQDSLEHVKQRGVLNIKKMQYEVEKSEREINELAEQNQFNKYLVLILIIVGGLVSLPMTFPMVKARKRFINESRSLKANTIRLRFELEKRKLTEEEMTRELADRGNELELYVTNLQKRNEKLESIKKGLESLRLEEGSPDKLHLDELITTVDSSKEQAERDWDNFQYYFQKVHEGFFGNLALHFPSLTSFDLRLCALIKLNLPSKQIANIMGVSNEGAKVARSRLRKKLNISSEDNFNAFFNVL